MTAASPIPWICEQDRLQLGRGDLTLLYLLSSLSRLHHVHIPIQVAGAESPAYNQPSASSKSAVTSG